MSHSNPKIRALIRASRSIKATRSHLAKYGDRDLSHRALSLSRWIAGELGDALALEARRGETGTSSIAEGDDIAVPQGNAQNQAV